MTEELYLVNISPAQMALRAVLNGNEKLLMAIVNATEIDVGTLATYKSHSDDHIGETFYLVFELVKRGNLVMLRHVVEKHGLSLRVREEAVLRLVEERIKYQKWQTETEEGRRLAQIIAHDDASWSLRDRTPYLGAGSLVEYTESLVLKIGAECDALLERQRVAENGKIALSLAVELANKESLLKQVKACLSYVHEKTTVPA